MRNSVPGKNHVLKWMFSAQGICRNL
ncbi:hypothetical protein R2601_03648 [Salipiger bermudensis HTCC2601]|uniref:Uncharacterized protein n=1 Tax=Salipiger bermudensis (strain DSM 26914 / JCM 13377 / KCTC 12554 / HTCC2601) TaxID=314265 RepID=Q0FWB6_SALBH|nr:hypothetical protein R2601_03648 [Salipiger bermudensis HTCC2601]